MLVRQDKGKGPTKIGLAHAEGWVSYLNDGMLFTKRFPHQHGKHYPDRGSNYETFTNEEILEMESLGPLVTLQPGHATEHTEHWHLVAAKGHVRDAKDVDSVVLPHIGGTARAK